MRKQHQQIIKRMKIFARVFFALALIILVAKAASAQTYTATAYRSKVTDSTTVTFPSGFGGFYYYNGRIWMKDGEGYFNPRTSTSLGALILAQDNFGANTYLFSNNSGTAASYFGVANDGISSDYADMGYFDGADDMALNIGKQAGVYRALFTDGRASPRGIEMFGDYSTSFINESLITKRYADNRLGSKLLNTTVMAPGSGQNGQLLYWDNALGKYSLKNAVTVAANGPLSVSGGPAYTVSVAAATTTTQGVAFFNPNDFDVTAAQVFIDYTNAQKATTSVNGILASADFIAFNNKLSSSRTITTTAPLLIDGGSSADLSADRTLSIASATTSALGVASFNASDFDVTAGAVSFDNTNAQKATTSTNGILTSTDWNTFNSKQAGSAVLTTIAGLSPATNDFMQYKAGAWANRTPTQALADLSAISTATTWGGKQNLTTTTTLAGLNVGSFAGNPSSLSDYDFWVNSSTTNISMRLAGQTVIVPRIGSGGGLTNSIPYLASSGGSFMNQSANFTFNGTTFSINGLTTLAANTSAIQTTGSLLFRSTSADIINLFKTGNTVTTAATNQVMNSFLHNNSYTASHTGLVVNGFIHDPTISGVQSGSAINKAFAASSGQFVMGSLTPTTGLLMDLQSTTQGFRMPTMTTTQMNAIGSPAEGFMVMNNTTHTPYFHNGTTWGPISSSGGISGLTTNRIPYATSSTTIGDDAGLTYDATNDEVTSRFKAAPTATLAGFSFGSTASDPSAPTAGGAWYNSANDVVVWKGASTKYYLPSVTAAIGAGRIQFGGVSGNFSLADNSGLTYNTGTSTLSTVNLTATGLAGTDSGIPVIDATGSFSRYPFYDITNFTNTANTFSYNVTATTAQPISSSWEYEFYGTGVDATTGAYGYKITAVVIRNSSGNYSIVGVNSTDIKSTGVTTATVTIVSNAVQLDVTTGLTGAKNHIRVTILSKSNQ